MPQRRSRHATPRASRRVILAAVLAIAAGTAALAAPAAQAVRAPTPQERAGVVKAWQRAHKKTARRLFVQAVRMSTVDSRYAAVLYDRKAAGIKPAIGFGPTTVEYFKRGRHHASDQRAASASGIVEDFVSLGQDAPPQVRDDADPVYRVTYTTTANEQITRHITWGCSSGPVTTESRGNYTWSVAFANVPISRPDLKLTDRSNGYFSGTETWSNGCGKGSSGCPASKTIHYRRGGLSAIERVQGPSIGRFFHSGYLSLIPGYVSDEACFEERGAFPMPSVEVPIPSRWFSSTPVEEETVAVDESDFPDIEKVGRLGNCSTLVADNNTCTESLDSFEGRITFRRTRRH